MGRRERIAADWPLPWPSGLPRGRMHGSLVVDLVVLANGVFDRPPGCRCGILVSLEAEGLLLLPLADRRQRTTGTPACPNRNGPFPPAGYVLHVSPVLSSRDH